ncbi:hypothetical protein ACFWHQ_14350 [Streptomyces sp. NPDC060334]|uniref:hypothetical protein n=1 Tax=unclassified Streptomyces TaxID=2593676 RepID=UPI00364BBD80
MAPPRSRYPTGDQRTTPRETAADLTDPNTLPNAAHLAARDGISTRTARRRIQAARQLGDEQADPDGR